MVHQFGQEPDRLWFHNGRDSRVKTIFQAAVLAAMGAVPAMADCQKPADAAVVESTLVKWINTVRAEKGLPALRPSAALKAAAQGHACDMAERGYFGHQRQGGPDLTARLRKAGYRYRIGVENIAKSRRGTAEAAAGIWRVSPQHWANLLNPKVKDIGLAVATDGTSVFYVFNAGR